MDTTKLEQRVAELEGKLESMVARWNEFVTANNGSATNRIAEIEKRCDKFFRLGGEISKMGEDIAKALKSHRKRFDDMESRGTPLVYRGVWAGVSGEYKKGDVITANSALWVAAVDNPGRPGDGESGWQLAVKSGGAK
jgi:hypothetical protein